MEIAEERKKGILGPYFFLPFFLFRVFHSLASRFYLARRSVRLRRRAGSRSGVFPRVQLALRHLRPEDKGKG